MAEDSVIQKIREKKRIRDIAAGCTIENMRLIATDRGGACLSVSYTDVRTKLLWRCRFRHEWRAPPSSIKAGSWCPVCAKTGGSYGERISRAVLERIFEVPFHKSKPKWLRGTHGRPLELDGYNAELSVAFEYNGTQHYEPDNRTSMDAVILQQERDQIKRRGCWDRGVSLIVVPAFADIHNLSACIDQIEAAILFSGLKIPKKWRRPSSLPELHDPLAHVFGPSAVAEMRDVAAAKGGRLLSETATGAKSLLSWECSRGHEWHSKARDIYIRGHWCPVCAKEARSNQPKKYDITDMRVWANQFGGECLSDEYIASRIKLRWRCSQGHEWDAMPNTIQRGSWCKICGQKEAGKKRREGTLARKLAAPPPPPAEDKRQSARSDYVDKLRILAKSNGGEFLSEVYTGSGKPHEWRCQLGHKWQARPNSVQQGKWCPYCSGRLGVTIETLKEIASSRGGICLSDRYQGSQTKYEWQCSRGHEWSAHHCAVRSGTWCPKCAADDSSGNSKKRLAAQGHTIDGLRSMARQRGGECLSSEYLGVFTHHRWQCGCGHQWDAIPNSIRRGRWCPVCAWDKRRETRRRRQSSAGS